MQTLLKFVVQMWACWNISCLRHLQRLRKSLGKTRYSSQILEWITNCLLLEGWNFTADKRDFTISQQKLGLEYLKLVTICTIDDLHLNQTLRITSIVLFCKYDIIIIMIRLTWLVLTSNLNFSGPRIAIEKLIENSDFFQVCHFQIAVNF